MDPKTAPNSIKNRSKIDPTRKPEEKNRKGPKMNNPPPILLVFDARDGRKLNKIDRKSVRNLVRNPIQKKHRFWKRFWVDFRATLVPKIDHKSIQEGIELAMQKKESHPGPDEMVVLMWRAVIFRSKWLFEPMGDFFFVEVGAVNSRRSAAMAADLLEFGRETEQN